MTDRECVPPGERDYRADPRMKIVREFLWREVLDDVRDGLPGDEIYWLWAEGLLRSIDTGKAVALPPEGGAHG